MTRALLAVLIVLAVVPAGASAATFGADLNAPSNNTGTCSQLGASSCMFFSGAPGPSFYAPQSGTVTAVRVRTGDFDQGPMQIVVMSSLYQNHAGDPGHPYFACCFIEAYGPTFTPARNAITTVATNLPMVEQPTPPPDDTTTNARGDFLAISVLAPNVPIPANFDNSSSYLGYAPAPNPQTNPAPSPNPLTAATDGFGYHMAMNADLDTGGGGGGGGGGGQGGTVTAVALPRDGTVKGRVAALPITCSLPTTCNGTLALLPRGATVAAKKKQKRYGTTHFTIAAGKKKTVKVKLNAAGRKLLRKHHRVKLLAAATIGGKTVTKTVKFVKKH